MEPNDIVVQAVDTGLAGLGNVSISSSIVNDNDVDLYEFFLDEGDRLFADIDAESIGSSLDPILRLFDASGVELAINDDFDGSDSFIEFVAPSSGTFFIGVSSFDNIDYDPVNGGGDTGDSSGDYDLFLEIPMVVANDNNSGAGSLRQAILDTNGNAGADTIIFDPSLSGSTIELSGAQLTITDDLTIIGLGAEELAIGLRPLAKPIDGFGNSRVFNIDDGNNNNEIGVLIEGLTITGGSASGDGGGIRNRENLTLVDTIVANNSTGDDGGGIDNEGSLTLNNSTVSGNTAADEGGGIDNQGSLTINESTVTGNTADDNGGGINNRSSGSLTLNDSTVSDNSAISYGSGYGYIYFIGFGGGISNSGTATLSASTVSGNSAFYGFGGGINNSGSLTLTNSTTSGNSAFYGGGGIDNSGILTLANSTVSDNSAAFLYGYFGPGGGINNSGSLILTGSTVSDNFAGTVGGGIFNDSSLTLTGSTVSGNSAYLGGGIFNDSSLILTGSTVSDNITFMFGEGGGIDNTGTATLSASTVSGNFGFYGGGINNSSSLTLTNSTVSGNSAATSGGISNSSTATLRNSTVAGNSAYYVIGGINNSGSLTLANTIVTNSENGVDVLNEDTIATLGVNLIEDGSLTGANIINADPNLSPLQDNGGSTLTQIPLPGSPAIDAGDNALIPDDTLDLDGDGNTTEPIPFDQRGAGFDWPPATGKANRLVNGTVDLGAVENQDPFPGALVVTNTNDGGAGSLREAIALANADAGADTIVFESGLNGSTVELSGAQLTISDDLTILGLGAEELAIGLRPLAKPIDGFGNSRIFNIDDGNNLNDISVTIEGLTITGGRASGDGGGIANRENLTLSDTIVANNSTGDDGGAIDNEGSLTLNNSTVSGNTAADEGGAIDNDGTLVVNNSTVSGNTAGDEGGGIENRSSGSLTLNGSTVSDNGADDGGAIDNNGSLTIDNSTISGNSANDDAGGVDNSGNLTSIASTVAGNSAGDNGGGIRNFGTLTLTNSTVSDNSAITSGGIGNGTFGSATATNTTIIGNSAAIDGGGISNLGTLSLSNSTVSGNSASEDGGGIYNRGSATLSNNIIANSEDGADLFNFNDEGTIATEGVNLIEDGSLTGSNIINADPLLSPLQDNGGSTLTSVPLAGSPAIDGGDNAFIPDDSLDLDNDGNISEAIPFDQRGVGFNRLVNGTVDLGAVENQVPFPQAAVMATDTSDSGDLVAI